jgi:competence protein ComGE
MLSRSEGFFLADAMLSLSSWLMAATVLLPLAMFCIGQTASQRQETNASHLLYDHLQQLKFSPGQQDQSSYTRGGTVFTIVMRDFGQGVPSEVCVEYEDYFRNRKAKCALAE